MDWIRRKSRSSDPKDAVYIAVGALKQALEIFNGVAGSFPMPGLQACVNDLLAVLDMIQIFALYLIMSANSHVEARHYARLPNTTSTG
ncbi:uncharacterized protein PHACADRAFT_248490 [Phanerochaete carnosa HHB-10118-sp]|uniref:Uncharacterized protein n=1 Tax=Phanerochaete carnosa (strain HHB-10118-sp) TaxID=650164 RepID=K5WCM2_PHACS|nr:uncharacterized protein PHACADRAFT_248490 [Phanerochaete carnosa HHB-10118-sp]EKM61718.1 hypothetical protein PHACADRAFT_248490 [Phanerochaete carnosa HHB-10118-sp]